MKPTQSSTFVLPALKTRFFWLGVYGGHYDIAVLFWTKPAHFEKTGMRYNGEDTNGEIDTVDLLAEQRAGNIAADMGLDSFLTYFPGFDLSAITQSNNRPRAIEIPKTDLMRVRLTLPMDKENAIDSISFHCDWR